MKDFFKKIILFCGIIATVSLVTNFTTPETVSADCRNNFLGMTSWDCNIVEDINSESVLVSNIVTIASNILTDITVIASYLVVGYVIWGGYLYMFSSGDPGKAAAGKKTLTHALIGLAITMSAYTIFGAIRVALISGGSLANCSVLKNGTCITPDQMVINIIQWVAGMAGVVSAIFIVVGGVGYMTSAGDPGKLQKAKSTIIYALIGLAIVALAEVITAFVASTVRDANAFTTSTVIANHTSQVITPHEPSKKQINKEII